MSSSPCTNSECDEENSKFYCESCIKNRLVYVKIISQIWKIVRLRFSPKLNELFSNSGEPTHTKKRLNIVLMLFKPLMYTM